MGVSSIFDQWIRLCRGLLLFFSFNLLGVSRHPHFHTFYATEVIDSLIINRRFKGMACRKWFITLHTWKSHCGKASILREVWTHHVSMQTRCQEKEKPPATCTRSCWGHKTLAGFQEPCRGAPKLQYHKRAGCGIPKEGRAKWKSNALDAEGE